MAFSTLQKVVNAIIALKRMGGDLENLKKYVLSQNF